MFRSAAVTTIERFILDQERGHPEATGEMTNLLYDIALAGKVIAGAVRRAGLVDVLGSAGNVNVQGEEQQKLDVFRANGRVHREHEELFTENSWVQVLYGQDVLPRDYHPMVDLIEDEELRRMVGGLKSLFERSVAVMPAHKDYIAKYCAAETRKVA